MPYRKAADGSLIPLVRSAEEVFGLIQKERIHFVDLHFTDLPGRLQHTTLPADQFQHEAFRDGVPKLDGSSIRGFVGIEESDLLLKPDPSTYAVIPWIGEDIKTARLICDVYWGFGQGRLPFDPRGIAQKAEQLVRDAGYGYSLWGPEIEFFVFDKVSWDVLNPYRGQSYSLESREAAWAASGTNLPIRFKEGYFPAPPQDSLYEYRSECAKILWENFGVAIDAHHHEVATAGQCEIDMYRDTLTNIADAATTYKYVTKNVAQQRGMVATFMPKPVYMDNASGMHTHVSLWVRNGGLPNDLPAVTAEAVPATEIAQEINLFYDETDAYAELSQVGRYFGGGLLDHSPSLAAIVAPTTNSYRRLVPGFEAPINIAWSRRNRSANIRIPVYEKGPQAAARKRIEYRTPDSSCNPYLCFAAIMAAGLDGLRKKIDIGDPVDEDIYQLTPERRHELGVRELPGSLKEALEALQSDHAYLAGVFSKELIEKVIDNGLTEYRQVVARPHPYEFHLYFDI